MGTLIEEKSVSKQACRAFFKLVLDGESSVHLGGSSLGQVVLGSIRKQDEQAIGNKSVSSTTLWVIITNETFAFLNCRWVCESWKVIIMQSSLQYY